MHVCVYMHNLLKFKRLNLGEKYLPGGTGGLTHLLPGPLIYPDVVVSLRVGQPLSAFNFLGAGT